MLVKLFVPPRQGSNTCCNGAIIRACWFVVVVVETLRRVDDVR
jgi:hypothetical protein